MSARILLLATYVTFPPSDKEITREYNNVAPGFEFNQALVSWNVEGSGVVSIEAKVHGAPSEDWVRIAGAPPTTESVSPRLCVSQDGTIRISPKARSLDLRVHLRTMQEGIRPELRLLALSFSREPSPTAPKLRVEGVGSKRIGIPTIESWSEETQPYAALAAGMNFWYGAAGISSLKVSPASLRKQLPELRGAPTLSELASLPGARVGVTSYLSQFDSLVDLAEWIEDDLPILCRVRIHGDGQWILVRGLSHGKIQAQSFEGKQTDIELSVRQFEDSWSATRRTVLLIYPTAIQTPDEGKGSPVWLQLHTDG